MPDPTEFFLELPPEDTSAQDPGGVEEITQDPAFVPEDHSDTVHINVEAGE